MLLHILHKNVLFWLMLSSVLMLSGCVTVPDVIKGTSATPVGQISLIQNAPKQFLGVEARFGGKVISTKNKEQRTVLEIAVMPLDSGARPVLGEPSQGRILASVSGFLDPADFNGHLITVVGPITGEQTGKINTMQYVFVTMNVTGFKRWHIIQEIVTPPDLWGPVYH